MKILCNVDQREALRQGIDAPSSTVEIEVDPGELSPPERDLLAELLETGGYRATRSVWRKDRYANHAWLFLVTPTFEGLRAELQAWLADRQVGADERAAKQAAADARIREMIAASTSRTVPSQITLSLRRDGAPTSWKADAYVSVEATFALPEDPAPFGPPEGASEAALTELHAARDAHAAAIAAARESLMPVARKALATKLAAEETETARICAERSALLSRLPPKLLARKADGFASDTEVSAAIEKLIIADVKYAVPLLHGVQVSGWDDSVTADHLSDLEYDRLLALKDQLAESPYADAEVEVQHVWDSGFDECDEPTEFNHRKVADISVSRGDVTAKLRYELTEKK